MLLVTAILKRGSRLLTSRTFSAAATDEKEPKQDPKATPKPAAKEEAKPEEPIDDDDKPFGQFRSLLDDNPELMQAHPSFRKAVMDAYAIEGTLDFGLDIKDTRPHVEATHEGKYFESLSYKYRDNIDKEPHELVRDNVSHYRFIRGHNRNCDSSTHSSSIRRCRCGRCRLGTRMRFILRSGRDCKNSRTLDFLAAKSWGSRAPNTFSPSRRIPSSS